MDHKELAEIEALAAGAALRAGDPLLRAPATAHELLRLRCPADSPRDAANHLALDVRLPLSLAAMTALASMPRCPCGRDLCVDVSPREALDSLRDLAAREAGGR